MEGAERFQGKKNEYTIMVDCQFENKKLLGAYDISGWKYFGVTEYIPLHSTFLVPQNCVFTVLLLSVVSQSDAFTFHREYN